MTDIPYRVIVDGTSAEGSARRVERSLRDLGAAAIASARATRGLEGSFQTLNKGVARSIDSVVSLRGAIAGLGVGLALREITRTVAGFQTQMAGVGAVTSATADEMKQLTALARELGSVTVFSAAEAASGMEFLGRAGFKTNQIVAALPGTLDLAAAGALDLGRAADIASNVLSSFNLEAAEMGRVSDVLAKAAASANTDVSQLSEALKFAAPVAAGFGVSIEQTTAAIGTLSNAGLQASLAGTGLRRVLSELATPSDELRAKMGGLSLTGDGLEAVMRQLAAAGISTAEAMEIFGERGGPAFSVMLQGIDTTTELTAALQEAAGEAKRLAEERLGPMERAFRELNSATEELMLVVGDNGLAAAFQKAGIAMRDFARSDEAVALAQNLGAAIEALVENVDILVVVFTTLAGLRIGAMFGPWGAAAGLLAGALAGLAINASLASDELTELEKTLNAQDTAIKQVIASSEGLAKASLEEVKARLLVAESAQIEADALAKTLETRLALAQVDADKKEGLEGIDAQQAALDLSDALDLARSDSEAAAEAVTKLRAALETAKPAVVAVDDAITDAGTSTKKSKDAFDEFAFVLQQVQDDLDSAKKLFTDTRTPTEALALEVERINALFGALAATLGSTAKAQEVVDRALADATDKYDAAIKAGAGLNRVQAEGKKLTESLWTPLEAYNAELATYNDLLVAGAISTDTFDRAVAQANERLAKAEGAGLYAETWKNALEDIQKTLTDSIEGALAGNLDSVKDFASEFMSIIRRLAANLLSQKFVLPVISAAGGALGFDVSSLLGSAGSVGQAAAGGTDILSSLSSLSNLITGGPSSLASSFATSSLGTALGLSIGPQALASTTLALGGPLGGAATGALAGSQAAAAATVASGGLTSAGAGLAAAAGPAAAIAAVLFAAYQFGLIGPNPSVGPVGIADFSPGLGRDKAFDVDGITPFTADNGGDPESLRPIAEAIADLIADSADRFSATIDDSLRFRVANYVSPEGGSGREQGFEVNAFIRGEAEKRIAEGKTQEQAIFEALKFAVTEAFTFESDTLAEAVRNTTATTTEDLLAALEFAKGLDDLQTEITALGGELNRNTLAAARLAIAIDEQANTRAQEAIDPIVADLKRALELFPAIEGTSGGGTSVAGLVSDAIRSVVLESDEGGIRGGTRDFGFVQGDGDGSLGAIRSGDRRFDISRVSSDNREGTAFALLDTAGEIITEFDSMSELLAGAGAALADYNDTVAAAEVVLTRSAEEQARYEANLGRVGFAIDLAKQTVSDLVDTITGEFEPAIRGPFQGALEQGQADIAALADHLADVNDQITEANEAFPELAAALIDVTAVLTQAQADLLANLQGDFNDAITAQINSATGLGAINTVQGLVDQRDVNRADAAALGLSTDRVDELFAAQINDLLSNVDSATVAAIISSGQITDDLATSIIGAVVNQIGSSATIDGQAADILNRIATDDLIAAELELIDARKTEAAAAKAAADQAGRNSRTLYAAAYAFDTDARLSNLGPEGRKDAALSQFDAALALANDNNPLDAESQDAIQRLPGLGRTALEAALDFYGSSTDYDAVKQRVQADLLSTASAQASIESQQLAVLTDIKALLGAANDNQALYVSAGNGQFVSTGAGGVAAGLDLGFDASKNFDIARAFTAAGIAFPGAGEGQLNTLRGSNPLADAILNAMGFASGGVFSGGNVIPFARGGVVSRATLFPIGMMGEAGDEAIMPLQRGADGSLGVRVNGGDSDNRLTFAMLGALGEMNDRLAAIEANTGRVAGEALLSRSRPRQAKG